MMIEWITELLRWSILLPISIIVMTISFFCIFGGFFKLLDFLCKDRKPKVLYSRNNPEQFWETEYFQGYGTLVGRLKDEIVIFSNDRSRYKLVAEKEFLEANPQAYDPGCTKLTWKDEVLYRDETYVANRSPVL